MSNSPGEEALPPDGGQTRRAYSRGRETTSFHPLGWKSRRAFQAAAERDALSPTGGADPAGLQPRPEA